MSLEWYLQQLEEHLNSNEHYSYVGRMTAINSIGQRLHKKYLDIFQKVVGPSKLFTVQQKKFLFGVQAQRFVELPKFHLIPKIHKEVPSTRPIVPTYSWGTSNLSKVLSVHLNQKVKSYHWIVKDTIQLINAFENLKLREVGYDCRHRAVAAETKEDRQKGQLRKQHSYRIITGDVTSLYTNIPTEEGCKAIEEIYDDTKDETIEVIDVELEKLEKEKGKTYSQLTHFVMVNNYFSARNEKIYRQRKGTAMGTNVAPEYANIYLAVKERNFINALQKRWQTYYFRYLDDICLLVPKGYEDRVVQFIETRLDRPLQINWTKSAKTQNFLDLEIEITAQNDIIYQMFRKPLNQYEYIPWSSFHPYAVKKGFVTAEVRRIIRTCKRKQDQEKQIDFLYRNLRKRGYPPKTCHTWLLQGKRHSQKRPTVSQKENENQKKQFFLKVKYHPIWENRKAGHFRKSMEKTISHYFGPIGLRYSKSRAPNIQDCINRNNIKLFQQSSTRLFHRLRPLEDNQTTTKRIRLLETGEQNL